MPPKRDAAEAWATDCVPHIEQAAKVVATREKAFRGARARAYGPLKAGKEVGSSVSFDVQIPERPLYHYLQVIDERDDTGGWGTVAGTSEEWTLQPPTRDESHLPLLERQFNVDWVRRTHGRIAIVRAIYWGRPPRHLGLYLEQLRSAADLCLAPDR